MTTSISSAATHATSFPTRAAAIRTKPRSRRMLIAGLVFAAGLLSAIAWAASGWTSSAARTAEVDKFIVAPKAFNVVLKEKGTLKAAKSTDIKCEVEGKSTIISLIEEGAFVKEGDLLVELASNEIEDRIRKEELTESNALTAHEAAKAELDIQLDQNASNIRKAELQIELKRLELDKYQLGDWLQRLKDAEIAIDQATILLQRREQDYNASKELFAKKYITQTEYQEDEFNYQKAHWEKEKAIQAKNVLEEYTHKADQAQKTSDLDEARKECERVKKNAEAEETKKRRAVEGKEKELSLTRDQLARLRTQKEKCRIMSPTQGFVVYYSEGGGRWMMSSDSQIKEGATVYEQQILMQVPDTSTMMAVVRVHEAKTDKLRMDQEAAITIEGLPGQQFTGKVTKIATVADSQSGWLNPDLKEYETEITLDAVPGVQLKPGVTAHAEILVETVESQAAVPVQAIYTKGGQRYVFRDGEKSYAAVELGAIGTEWAEIRSGLSAGDRVRLAFSDDDKRLIPDAGPGERGNSMRMRQRPTDQAGVTAAPSAARPAQGAGPQPQQRQMRRGGPPGGGQGRSGSGRTP
jgi:HlyD family secretion protein